MLYIGPLSFSMAVNHPLSVNKFNPGLMLYSGIVRVTSSLVREHMSISVDLASVQKPSILHWRASV